MTVRTAADVFLGSLGNADTLRSYDIEVGRAAERLGEARPLATIADDEIGATPEQLWGEAAVNTWNARRASVLSWLGWCDGRGYDGPQVPAWAKRLPPPGSQTSARSKMSIDRLITRRDVHLREKTLWRMPYEARARPKVVSSRDVCPDTGLVRLSYGQAGALLDAHTAVGGVPGTGWDLHDWRHSGLTHLGEAGASNCQKLWTSGCSRCLLVQVGEPFDGVQASLRGGVRVGVVVSSSTWAAGCSGA